MRPGIERQIEIFSPTESRSEDRLPIAPEEWEERSRATLSREAFDYVAGGAGSEETMRENVAAFTRHRLVPRMLGGVSETDLNVNILATAARAPFFLAPIGAQSVIHPDADLASAHVAAQCGIPYILSTVASATIEAIADVMGNAPRWFQLYTSKDPEIVDSMIGRAEASGYRALVVTVDTPMFGWRERDLRNGFLPYMKSEGIDNFLTDPVFLARLGQDPRDSREAAIALFRDVFAYPELSWKDLGRIAGKTRLPLVVKGILHPDDARRAIECGAQGVIVSNHGGRQLDGEISSLEALIQVAGAVKGRTEILMDGGIRRGSDVLKALALGASAVLLGRPFVYGLAVAGQDGVREVLRNLIADIDLSLGLCGLRSIAEIDSSILMES